MPNYKYYRRHGAVLAWKIKHSTTGKEMIKMKKCIIILAMLISASSVFSTDYTGYIIKLIYCHDGGTPGWNVVLAEIDNNGNGVANFRFIASHSNDEINGNKYLFTTILQAKNEGKKVTATSNGTPCGTYCGQDAGCVTKLVVN
jgi:hypothetical protein